MGIAEPFEKLFEEPWQAGLIAGLCGKKDVLVEIDKNIFEEE